MAIYVRFRLEIHSSAKISAPGASLDLTIFAVKHTPCVLREKGGDGVGDVSPAFIQNFRQQNLMTRPIENCSRRATRLHLRPHR